VRLITSGIFRGLAEHHARVLMVDPPWRFKTFTADPGNRAPPYPTMPMDEIAALPVSDLAARNCWLFLWTSGPFLQHSMNIMQGWGFRYSSVAFTWVKIRRKSDGFHQGTGKTTRKNTEIVLLGKIGSPPILHSPDELLVQPEDDDLDGEVLVSRLREHSRKPDEIRSRIERMAGGPRLELFARQRFENWTAWGNQADKWAPLPKGETDGPATGN
jgi:N6-adenosine-specific RNA methylase IME4